MKIKVGDTIRCIRKKDEWLVLSTQVIMGTDRDIFARCLNPGDTSFRIGLETYLHSKYIGWEVLPSKSLNFNNLYDKLNEN